MKRRILALLLAAVMLCTLLPASVFAARTPRQDVPKGDSVPFTDVSRTAYYYLAVLWAVERGVTAGTSQTTFSPNDPCTRAQVVTFLWRASGQPEPQRHSSPFADVKPGDYYYKAVLWAVERGVTSGTGDHTFSPNDKCTRAQIATFLWRYAGSPTSESGSNPFADVAFGAYYYNAVLWAVQNGITAGTDKHSFSPHDVCTRAQVVTFLYRDLVGSDIGPIIEQPDLHCSLPDGDYLVYVERENIEQVFGMAVCDAEVEQRRIYTPSHMAQVEVGGSYDVSHFRPVLSIYRSADYITMQVLFDDNSVTLEFRLRADGNWIEVLYNGAALTDSMGRAELVFADVCVYLDQRSAIEDGSRTPYVRNSLFEMFDAEYGYESGTLGIQIRGGLVTQAFLYYPGLDADLQNLFCTITDGDYLVSIRREDLDEICGLTCCKAAVLQMYIYTDDDMNRVLLGGSYDVSHFRPVLSVNRSEDYISMQVSFDDGSTGILEFIRRDDGDWVEVLPNGAARTDPMDMERVELFFDENCMYLDQLSAILDGNNEPYVRGSLAELFNQVYGDEIPLLGIQIRGSRVTQALLYYSP